jgi:hypothetical protein
MSLTPQQVARGFWALDVKAPPAVIEDPVEYRGTQAVTIACTQLADTARQRRLVRAWRTVLPTLTELRFLWLTSRVPQDLFEAACRVPSLEGLYIKWSTIKDLRPLIDAPTLRYVHIGSTAKAADPKPVGRLTRLTVLELESMPSLCQLEVLGELANLEQLAVEGGMWVTQHVESLAPLARLVGLRHLGLANLRAADPHSLRALASLTVLEHLRLAMWWPKEDLQFLSKALPRWRFGTEVVRDAT